MAIFRLTVSYFCILQASILVLPVSAFAQDEPIPIKMFSRSSGGGAAPVAKTVGHAPIFDRREHAIRLNEQGVALVFQGRRRQGIAKIKQALAHDPENTTILYNLAGIYLNGDEARKAIPIMKKALEVEPEDISYLGRYADACVGSNKVNKAIKTFEHIVELDPNFGEAQLKLGTLYGVKQQWSRAEKMLLRAQEHLGDDPRLLSNLGSILIAAKKFDRAIEVLQMAQSKSRTSANAIALGMAFESLGKHKEALSHYRQAKVLGEGGEDLDAHMQRIEEVLAEKQ